jgi:hypothetical protein
MYHLNAYMHQRVVIVASHFTENMIIGKVVLNGLAINQFQIMHYVLGNTLTVIRECIDAMMESLNGVIVVIMISLIALNTFLLNVHTSIKVKITIGKACVNGETTQEHYLSKNAGSIKAGLQYLLVLIADIGKLLIIMFHKAVIHSVSLHNLILTMTTFLIMMKFVH